MRRVIAGWAAVGILLAAAIPASADGFQLPGFSKKRGQSTNRVRARVGDETPQAPAKESTWSMPRFQLPKWELPAPKVPFVSTAKETRSVAHKKPAGPSTWTKMKQGTSNFIGKTTDFLTPWKKKEQPRTLGPRPPQNRPAKKPSSGFSFTGWITGSKPKPEPKTGPRSVKEFIGLPRVGSDRKR